MKHFLMKAAFAAALSLAGLVGLAQAPASAAPVSPGLAAPAIAAERGLVQQTQWGPPPGYYGPRRHWGGPPPGYYRRGWGPRPVYGYGYRPFCRTVYRQVYSPRWGYVSRPVRICR